MIYDLRSPTSDVGAATPSRWFTTWLKSAAIALVSAFCLLPSAFSQGSLTPPGAPAPTMKTLDQIEARTPISSAPFTISNPGSYYLISNLNVTVGNAITIATNGVRLDLNGFTISSTEAVPTGVGILLLQGVMDITIVNGQIKGNVAYNGGVYSGSGFAYGIFYLTSPPLNVRIAGVMVSGCLDDGIHLGSINSSVVESCTVYSVGGEGIVASSVIGSTAKLCGGDGISADTVADSSGNSAGAANGIDASFSAKNCNGSSAMGVGVNTSAAENDYGSSLNGDGLDATTAGNCYGFSSGGVGLSATVAQNCYGISSSGLGLYARSAMNCYGESSSYDAMNTSSAEGCYGLSGGGGNGISAITAINCYGLSEGNGNGISASTAMNCQGASNGNGYGVTAAALANNCIGVSSTGTAIRSYVVNSCFGATLSYTYKFNMP